MRYPIGTMFFLRRPTEQQIRSLLAERESAPFSYPSVGATRAAPPPGWRINHLRALAGKGSSAYEATATALFSWQLLAIQGLKVFPSTPVLQPHTNVAILSRHFGIWSVDFCRVVYVLMVNQNRVEQFFAPASRTARYPVTP